MEIWKSIPGFSLYEASNCGNIRSLNYKRTNTMKVLKPSKSDDGYLKTMLLNDLGKYKSWTIHNFVALTFLGEKPKNKEINHKDGNKTNNSIENLEYVTRSENCKHSFDIGLQKPKRGELNGMSKLTSVQVAEIRLIAKNGGRYWGRNELAKKYGVTAKHLQDIVNNPESWK